MDAPVSPTKITLLTPFRLRLIACGLTILLVLIPLWDSLDKGGSPLDEGGALVLPEMVLKGALPYRDFETFYGPGNLYVLAGAYAAFGTHIETERGVGILYRVLILATLFVIFQRWGIGLAVAGTLTAGIVLLPVGVTAFAWIGAVACAIAALWLCGRPDKPARCLFGGLLAVAALLYRPDLGPAVIVSALPLFLLMTPCSRRAWLLGGLLALLPLLTLTLAIGPMPILNDLFILPVLRCSGGRYLPMSTWPTYLAWVVALHFLACAINLTASILTVSSSRKSEDARLLLSLTLFSLAITTQALQRVDQVHLPFAAFLSLGLLPVSLGLLLARGTGWPASSCRTVALATLAAWALIGTLAPVFPRFAAREFWWEIVAAPATGTKLVYQDRSFPLNSVSQVMMAGPILDVLGKFGKPGERLFVGPGDLRRTVASDTELYHLLPQFVPASYFLEMNPYIATRPGSRLSADLATADWIVLNKLWDGLIEPNASAQPGPDEPNEVVRTKFERLARHGTFELYRRKRAAPAP